jgi:phytoene dehydrogenase-like protein
LAAAITLAAAGQSVLVVEAADTVGGGARSAELTLPGFVHDVCSAIHPLAVASPVFAEMPLADYGLQWIRPPVALAHPLDDRSAALLHQDLGVTGKSLGADAPAWQRLFAPLVEDWDRFAPAMLGPLRIPRHPLETARFGLFAIQPAMRLAQARFCGARARALFAGMAAHSMLPLRKLVTEVVPGGVDFEGVLRAERARWHALHRSDKSERRTLCKTRTTPPRPATPLRCPAGSS